MIFLALNRICVFLVFAFIFMQGCAFLLMFKKENALGGAVEVFVEEDIGSQVELEQLMESGGPLEGPA